jgi:hypothetical protein
MQIPLELFIILQFPSTIKKNVFHRRPPPNKLAPGNFFLLIISNYACFFRNVMLAQYAQWSRKQEQRLKNATNRAKKMNFKNSAKGSRAFQALTILSFELPTCYRSCLWLFLAQRKCMEWSTALTRFLKAK